MGHVEFPIVCVSERYRVGKLLGLASISTIFLVLLTYLHLIPMIRLNSLWQTSRFQYGATNKQNQIKIKTKFQKWDLQIYSFQKHWKVNIDLFQIYSTICGRGTTAGKSVKNELQIIQLRRFAGMNEDMQKMAQRVLLQLAFSCATHKPSQLYVFASMKNKGRLL